MAADTQQQMCFLDFDFSYFPSGYPRMRWMLHLFLYHSLTIGEDLMQFVRLYLGF